MKKLLLLFVFGLLFSCEAVGDTNNPGFQIEIDGVTWNAMQTKAIRNANGTILIRASSTNEVFEILIPSANVGDYVLKSSGTAVATYNYNLDNVNLIYTSYTTPPTGTVNQFPSGGSGFIKIRTKPKQDAGTISGELQFQGKHTINNPAFLELRNFYRGSFYNIPIEPAP
jgi:hypothetical protein